jgi:hypothetical protein
MGCTSPKFEMGLEINDSEAYFQLIKVQDLNIDHSYQRDGTLSYKWVESEFKKNGFRPDLCETLEVGHSGPQSNPGPFWVIDGQARVQLLRLGGVDAWMCRVHPNWSSQRQAQWFTERSQHRRQNSSNDIHRARLHSGDPLALRIEQVVAECGLGPVGSKQRNSINASQACYWICKRDARNTGQECSTSLLRKVVELASAIWAPPTKNGYLDRTLKGLSIFVEAFSGDATMDEMKTHLRDCSPSHILKEVANANVVLSGSTNHGAFAEFLRRAFNASTKRSGEKRRQLSKAKLEKTLRPTPKSIEKTLGKFFPEPDEE